MWLTDVCVLPSSGFDGDSMAVWSIISWSMTSISGMERW